MYISFYLMNMRVLRILNIYYDYDNQEFSDFLTQRGFNISYGSHNTESIWTSTIVPNILNLSYVASDDITHIDNMARSENAYHISALCQ